MGKLLLIGNGRGVLDNQLGGEIDLFDVVVRLGTFKTDGFEKFVGTKTDLIITAHWKLDYERMKSFKTFVTFPVFYEKMANKELGELEKEVLAKLDDKFHKNVSFMTNQDMEEIKQTYSILGKTCFDVERINPSLGYRALWYVMKNFSGYEKFVYGFDFFKTGWYWKEEHNRDLKNRHPYIYERTVYELLKKRGEIFEL